MNSGRPISRRESLRKLLQLTGCLALTGTVVSPSEVALSASTGSKNGFLVVGTGRNEGYSARELTRRTFEAMGGMGRFVSNGDAVVIKPNISWARPPEFAADTSPEVLDAVVELCQESGAGKIRIADNTIQEFHRCAVLSGAEAVSKKRGVELVVPNASLLREMKLGGNRLDVWPVFVPLVEADKLINIPVAKHHTLTTVTLGMKNWIGGIGGKRGTLHKDINQVIVDLANFFKPTLTLIDATRIMIRNGPSGGTSSDVIPKNTLILSDDQVAADARACLLFDRRAEDVAFIKLAQGEGVGTSEWMTLEQCEINL
jgi:uncharacterized protein (DUF362 family)